jgi:hypothetical protein
MNQYDVTIKLRVLDLGRPPGGKGEPQPFEQVIKAATGVFLQDLAGHTTARAAEVLHLDVLDHSTLPQPALICRKCEGEVR